MDLRIFTEPQQGATYDELLRVAKATEDLGFDAFFRSDHYLTIGGDGGVGSTDAWVTLAGLARETSRIRLGTLVTPVTFRLPGPLAISVAQVDQMSGGRVELGLGAGWFDGEHTAYGIPFPGTAERFEQLEEQLQVVRGLWAAEGHFSFAGKHFQLPDSPALPKPVQRPGPPVVMGGFHAALCPDEVARHAEVVVIGEAELTWPQVIDDARHGTLKKIYRQEKRPSLAGLKPDRAVFRGKRYLPIGLVEAGRGCHFKCEFCAVQTVFDSTQTRRPVDDIIAELRLLKGEKKLFFFVDDNITSNLAQAKEFFRALIPLKVLTASKESPPSSKKLSTTLTRSIPNSSAQSVATAISCSVRGATNGAPSDAGATDHHAR